MKLGIRTEDKSQWERRVPLVPADAKALKEAGMDVAVQTSHQRAFSDEEFDNAGVAVQEDLSDCNIIVGIKEIPKAKLEAGKVYLFFPHVIKGQPANMPMLQRLMELKATLVDYERIVDEKNRRLIFFGRHAGLAGMINTLWSLGKRLEVEGAPSVFSRLKQARTYADLSGAKEDLERIAARIAADGVPAALHPLVVGFTGYGNVSQGAQEILEILPVETVSPAELKRVAQNPAGDAHRVYKVVFTEADLVEPKAAGGTFDLQDYYLRGAGAYRGVFDRYADDLSVLVNCVYWDERYPRLLSLDQCRRLWAPGRSPKLKVIGDISCDVGGSIECTVKATEPGSPVYVYEPLTGAVRDGFAGEGPVMMAVDILPSEIPRESSADFSRVLKPLLPHLAAADVSKPFAELALPPELKRAVIVYKGELTPDYAYLDSFLAPAARP
ncbi:MAG: bifunctional lysine ketoglutarate reductase /saccharopine dehydrogenase family protein [Desulfobacterales bacterium]|jgi:alpha-aminoadipic semialdehyde synthase|nr:bifunctional lysine ketoglutarate reductase /saccharopine dehydrogenase family protein [Desulfobacterales bacterium]